MKMKNKQTTPKWFDGSIYEQGAEVVNPFSGETYKLGALELSIYDFIMGCNHIWAMGIEPKKETVDDFDKALTWFRTNNTKAYMALLD